jgi:DNA-binding transcriptional MerR regulator
MTTGRSLTIGEVIGLLKEEFPDVSISKLRFLEGKGLVSPSRTVSGYRQFHTADVERIRYVLRQQRDQFLPLKVIKSKLASWERGERSSPGVSQGPPPEAYFAASSVRLSAEELARTVGMTPALVGLLVENGLLEPKRGANGQFEYSDDDLAIARAAFRLISHGLEPRHLRTLRLAANRETDLLTQLTGPLLRHRSPASRRRAAQVLADCAEAATELQEALLRSQLRVLLES